MFGKSNKPAMPPGHVPFDFEFSEDERERTRITKSEIDALLEYSNISDHTVSTKEFTATTITVNDKDGTREKRVKLLSRLGGTIKAEQYNTLRGLLGKS